MSNWWDYMCCDCAGEIPGPPSNTTYGRRCPFCQEWFVTTNGSRINADHLGRSLGLGRQFGWERDRAANGLPHTGSSP